MFSLRDGTVFNNTNTISRALSAMLLAVGLIACGPAPASSPERPEPPEPPAFNPPAGTYEGEINVTILDSATRPAGGLTFFYTLDGTSPTRASTEYTTPITITADTTITAIAVRNDMVSEPSVASYVVTPETPCTHSPCRNGGICSVVDGEATCTCVGGFIGLYCQDDPTNETLVTMNGTVYDVDGALIDGATVTATSLNSSVPFSGTTSTTNGVYSINNVPAGVQIAISVTKTGYAWRQRFEVLRSNLEGDPNANRFDFHAYEIESFVVTGDASVLEVGSTTTLTATVTYTDRAAATNVTTTSAWSVDAPIIATVGASTGVVSALTSGVATVTASFTDGTLSASDDFEITVAAACPEGFVRIPHDPASAFTTADFCLAKYIASGPAEDETAARSVSGEAPWTSIDYAAAKAACEAMGAGYHLVTNDEWQTAARNIESVPSNWSLGHLPIDDMGAGTENTNALSRGKIEGPTAGYVPVAASDDDNDACYLTESTCDLETWSTHRRTFVLDTGDVLWDMAGNVWQWVDYGTAAESGYAIGANMMSLTDDAHAAARSEFGPLGEYDFLLDAAPYGGLGYAELFFRANEGIFRGGSLYGGVARQGIFSVRTDKALTYTDSIYGFRCAYTP